MQILEVLRKCNGCRSCELACSFRATDMFWSPASAIRVCEAPKGFAVNYLIEVYPDECDLCLGEPAPRCQTACGLKVLDIDALTKLRESPTKGHCISPGA